MGRTFRLLSAARRAVGALALACVALSSGACSTDEGCEFAFAEDAVTHDAIPWVCRSGTAVPLTILFSPEGSGALDGTRPFSWRVTSCRSAALDFADGEPVDLFEVGGNVAVGRLTFAIDGATYLCGYGVPAP